MYLFASSPLNPLLLLIICNNNIHAFNIQLSPTLPSDYKQKPPLKKLKQMQTAGQLYSVELLPLHHLSRNIPNLSISKYTTSDKERNVSDVLPLIHIEVMGHVGKQVS